MLSRHQTGVRAVLLLRGTLAGRQNAHKLQQNNTIQQHRAWVYCLENTSAEEDFEVLMEPKQNQQCILQLIQDNCIDKSVASTLFSTYYPSTWHHDTSPAALFGCGAPSETDVNKLERIKRRTKIKKGLEEAWRQRVLGLLSLKGKLEEGSNDCLILPNEIVIESMKPEVWQNADA